MRRTRGETLVGEQGEATRSRLGAVRGAVLLALTIGFPLLVAARTHTFALDFHYEFAPAARNVLDGVSPYPDVAGGLRHIEYVYPPLVAILTLPLALLPSQGGDWAATFLMVACVLLTLRVLGIRSLPCYAVVFIWPPTVNAIINANPSLPLALAAALAWRYRDRVVLGALAPAVAVAVKLMLWPLIVWQFARQRRTGLLAAALAAGLLAASFAVVGFNELPRFVDALDAMRLQDEPSAITPLSFLVKVGVSHPLAQVVTLALASAVLAWSVSLARRPGAELRSFTLAIVASLLFSPIVWSHYFVLMMVPLAIARPRFDRLWLLPLVLWATPASYAWHAWQIALTLGVMAAIAVRSSSGDPTVSWLRFGERGTRPRPDAAPAG